MNAQAILRQYIHQFVQPSDEQMDLFLQLMDVQKVAKGEILVEAGSVCQQVWFVTGGILRHYLLHNGKEGTVWFSFEGDIITDIGSLVTQRPAVHNIIAVTDCELLSMAATDLQFLYDTEKVWERFGRLTSVHYLLLQMDRVNDLLFKTGREKYEDFIASHPTALQYIPLQQIADYIGITSETLSRIRGKRI